MKVKLIKCISVGLRMGGKKHSTNNLSRFRYLNNAIVAVGMDGKQEHSPLCSFQ